MKNLQKMGGIAALFVAAIYVVIFLFLIFLMDSFIVVDPVQQVALLVDNQAIMYIMNLILFVATGIFLVVLALALYERLKAGSPAIMQVANGVGKHCVQ